MWESLVGPNPFAFGGLLLIEAEVLMLIQQYQQDTPDKLEAGGILVGYRRGPHLHIVQATPPTPSDTRGRTQFHRSASAHSQIALEHWKTSGGTVDYLGEWHTHPEKTPSPSQLDLEQWLSIHNSRRDTAMVFIIVGNTSNNWYGVGKGQLLRRTTLAPPAR